MTDVVRCAWASDEPERTYHDVEWGVAQHDDRALFETLVLESAQAGLSWRTILRKRDGYRALFAGFDAAAVAAFDEVRIAAMAVDARIVRHRGKIEAAVATAHAVLAIGREHGSFDRYVWSFVDGRTLRAGGVEGPVRAEAERCARRLSVDLRARGCRFVGPTIVYAFMQAAGLIDDHRPPCFRAT